MQSNYLNTSNKKPKHYNLNTYLKARIDPKK